MVRLRHWHKWRADRRALAVNLHELNRQTIPEAEQRMRENAESRVMRIGVMRYRGNR